MSIPFRSAEPLFRLEAPPSADRWLKP
jgi:hypothetical protein